MPADSFHALVEKGIKKKKKLQDFQDLVDIVNDREAMVLKSNDFFKMEKNLSSAQYAIDKPYLEDVQVVRFLRGSEKLHWKRSYDDDEFESAIFLQKMAVKIMHTSFPSVDTHTHAHTRTHTCIHTHAHAYTHTCTHPHAHL